MAILHTGCIDEVLIAGPIPSTLLHPTGALARVCFGPRNLIAIAETALQLALAVTIGS